VTLEIPLEAVRWHLNGEKGISSDAIFDRLYFGRTNPRWSHNWPHDPDDFRRCELLLREVPELRGRLPEMAAVHPVWARLVERWDEITALMEEEVPGVFEGTRGQCPRSYSLIREAVEPAVEGAETPQDAA
jgi:hypothetical protein